MRRWALFFAASIIAISAVEPQIALASDGSEPDVSVTVNAEQAQDDASGQQLPTNVKCGDSVTWSLELNNGNPDNPTYTLRFDGTGTMSQAPDSNTIKPYKDKITKAVVGDGITNIVANALSNYALLEELHIGDAVSTYTQDSWHTNKCLKRITVAPGNNVFTVGKDCALYTDNGATLALYPLGMLEEGGSYKAPWGVTKIGPGAFRGAGAKLTSVDLNGITQIEQWAFAGDSIVSLSIPQSVQKVGVSAFSWCTSLKTVVFDGSELYFSAFQHLRDLSSFTIGEHVQSIVLGALGVDGEASSLPSSIDLYYNAANATVAESFLKNFSLANTDGITLHIGASVQTIPAKAFSKATNGSKHLLKAVIFEKGASCTIGDGAFASNPELALIDASQAGSLTIANGAFSNIASGAQVYVNDSLKDTFAGAGVDENNLVEVSTAGLVTISGGDHRVIVGESSEYGYTTTCTTDATVTSSDETVATAELKDDKVVVTGVAPGTCVIEISFPVSEDVSSASARITVTVLKKTEINVDESVVPNGELQATYGDPSKVITYTVTDDLPVTASSSNVNVAKASIDGGELTVAFGNVGTATVTLSCAGDPSHSPASTEFTVNVGKKKLIITPKDKSCYVGDKLPELGDDDFDVVGLVDNDSLVTKPTLSYGGVATDKVGVFNVIEATGAYAGDNYDIDYAKGKLIVSNRPVAPSPSETTTVTKPDGSTVTTVKNKETGTETVTHEYKEGVVVVTAKEAGKDVRATVTLPEGVTPFLVTLPVEATEATVAAYADTREAINRCVPTDDGLAVLVSHSCELVVRENAKSFSDMSGHWAQPAVDFASARGLMNGIGNTGTFEPETMTSRAMVCAVLSNLEYGPEATTGLTFADTASDGWYADAVAWAAEAGIVHGYGDGSTFGPGDDVTREQMACMIFNYAKAMGMDVSKRADLSAFGDAGELTFGREAMEWCVASGIFHGYDGGEELGGLDGLTRGQCAAVLMNLVTLIVEG